MDQITTKQSKTDPFRQGVKNVTLSLSCTGHKICPVQAKVPYQAKLLGATEQDHYSYIRITVVLYSFYLFIFIF